MKLSTAIFNLLNRIIKSRPYSALHLAIFGDIEYRQYRSQQFLLSTAELHRKTFPQFRNINSGKDVVVVACGPSVEHYKVIPNAIHIGVNRAIYSDRIKFDYWFIEDLPASSRNDPAVINRFREYPCTKFYGLSNIEDPRSGLCPTNPPESEVLAAQALRYRHDFGTTLRGWDPQPAYDLATQPIGSLGTVAFSALQFALWTNPRRIFLVGCDNTATGHFYKKDEITNLDTQRILIGYKKIKQFAACYYPDTEIISVNPVGLRGMFTDWDQDKGPLENTRQA